MTARRDLCVSQRLPAIQTFLSSFIPELRPNAQTAPFVLTDSDEANLLLKCRGFLTPVHLQRYPLLAGGFCCLGVYNSCCPSPAAHGWRLAREQMHNAANWQLPESAFVELRRGQDLTQGWRVMCEAIPKE